MRSGTDLDLDPGTRQVAAGLAVAGDAENLSLRERKKAKTRAALIAVSQRLFAEQGYTGTTLDDISAAAEITTPTLLRYFESKAHLALAPQTDPLGRLEHFLADEARSVGTLGAWWAYVRMEAEESSHPTEDTTATYVANLRAYHEWVDKDPALVATVSQIQDRLQGVLARALAVDAGADPDDLHSTMIAALLVAGRRAVWDRWLARGFDADSLVEDQLAVVDYAIESMPRPDARGRRRRDL